MSGAAPTDTKSVAWLDPELQAQGDGPLDGFTQIPNRVLFDLSLSRPARLLYAILLSLDPPDRETSTLDDLAEMLGSSRPSVIRYLDELERAGLLAIERRAGSVPNLYRLTAPGAAED